MVSAPAEQPVVFTVNLARVVCPGSIALESAQAAAMFGISYVELVLVLGIGSVILGPKDLPRVARTAGQATGRAAAYLTAARTKFARFAKETELDKLHVEMQQSMQQLQAIQSELRGNMSFTNPGPMARRAMQHLHNSQSPSSQSPGSQSPGSQSPGSMPHPESAYQQQPPVQHLGHQQIHDAAQTAAVASSFAASAAGSTAVASQAAALVRAQAVVQQAGVLQQPSTAQHVQDHQQAPASSDTLQPLPVSAVALGKAPSRSDSTPTGSEILLDALYEQEVAHQAQQFLNTEQGQAMLRDNGTRRNE